MKHIITMAAILTATSAYAENYTDFGNVIGSHGEITIKNADSSYEVGDVVFKQGATEDYYDGATLYREYDGLVVETNRETHKLDFHAFDNNGNAVIAHHTPYTKPEDIK